jgi:hypothetical protein
LNASVFLAVSGTGSRRWREDGKGYGLFKLCTLLPAHHPCAIVVMSDIEQTLTKLFRQIGKQSFIGISSRSKGN